MHGKSFLIRALQYREETVPQPAPIPSPGAKAYNHYSTSSDIHLYADRLTASGSFPILYLDCEGFDGAGVPLSLKGESVKDRRNAKNVYPRLVYAFSTCVVFVANGPLAASHDVKAQLILFAHQGARGSRNQGFKPSLFIVFNRFEGGDAGHFNWSIEASTKAFLKDDALRILNDFYSQIQVVYIPRMDSAKAAIALQQLDAFDRALRKEHEEAFQLRKDFRLSFTPSQLTLLVQRALDRLSKDNDAVLDWSVEAPLATFSSNQSQKMLTDLWSRYLGYHASCADSAVFRRVRDSFEKHVTFCLRLHLTRYAHRLPGLHVTEIPPQWVEQVNLLLFEYAGCGASHAGDKCEKVQYRHADYHEHSKVSRWPGEYELDKASTSLTFRQYFETTLKAQSGDVSLRDICKLAK